MELHSGAGLDQWSGVYCRQSRLRGTVGGLVMCALFVGTVPLARHLGAPRLVWIGCLVLAALFVSIFLRDIIAKLRPTNWVLQLDPDGLWINLRPLQLRPLQPSHAAEAPTAFHLSYAEITCVHRHVDTWSMPGSEHQTVQYKLESLDVHLASGDTGELSPALAEARASGKGLPTSVTVPAPGLIRIAWRGNGHDIVPGLGWVLAEMGQRVAVAATTRTDRPDWRQLSDADLDEQIEHLVRWGDPLAATVLLTCHCGRSPTEAQKLVTELTTRV